ncbi:SLAP domain-containing protein [Lactobacillus sp.]|uniref:SLAP domain-containing protein n=1 Tax=Lactobacillus sp. TaxID=1591 RepID=UPI0025DF236B|nr:SLAP domain-containing protein [Lactobacillus sp.]MCO6534446.1 SLAP domain-containing protein [Lactobacillus sp.]
MKKNLRIVSAAAAALLAVAPVAATSVSTVFADIDMAGQGGVANNSGDTANLSLTVKNALSLTLNDPASKLQATLSYPTLPAGASVSAATTSKTAEIYKSGEVVVNDKGQLAGPMGTDGKYTSVPAPVGNFTDVNQQYVAVAHVTITGLDKTKKYTLNLGSSQIKDVQPDGSGVIADLAVISKPFSLSDTTKLGAPFLKENKGDGKAVSTGTVSLSSNQYSVAGVVAAIGANYIPDITDASADKATASWTHLTQDVRDALKAAGITTKNDKNESFDKPAAPFNVTVNLSATNGKTGSAVITVDPNSNVVDSTFPRINYFTKGATAAKTNTVPTNGKSATTTIDSIDDLVDSANNSLNVNYVPINGIVDTAAIKRAFTAQVSEQNTTPLDVTIDTSKVNTKVAGKYPVTVSATNADKKTSNVIFLLTVGAKGATYKTVQSDGDIPVYKIEGNTVTDTKTTVKNGDQIAVFGDAIKVGDKSYTRINSADSDLYVETKYVDGSFKPAEKTSKTVMHNAYIYDKDHKRVGTKTLAAYTKVDVLGVTTKLADGSLVYQIGDNQYVMADNIDGTVRTLSHNAYVYKTSKKRADRRVLRKGAKVTTYGSPYTFKNGKAYYRIGGPAKQYVKVANFN